MLRYIRDFDTYEEATKWLHAHKASAVCEEMFPSGWRVTLEGSEAKRVLEVEHPIHPQGFRLLDASTLEPMLPEAA